MAEATSRSRGRTCVSVIKCIFRHLLVFCLLLCLVYISSWNKIKLADKNRRNAAITMLFELTRSVDNMHQLEIFKETLHTAIEEEERLKAENKYEILTVSRAFDAKVKQLIPRLELIKMATDEFPPLQEIIEIAERFLQNIRIHFDKKLALLEE